LNGEPATPRLVLDTNVWLDGLVFEDARAAPLFAALRRGRVAAMTDGVCWEEWQRVLRYPVLKIAPARCVELERTYESLATRLDVRPEEFAAALPRCRDPDDQKFLDLARASGASALLSRDAELLRLSRRCERAFGFVVQAPDVWVAAALDTRE
jgi:putative PIN family toxin of toxin-antitoxin system